MSKKTLLIIIVIVVAAAGIWLWWSKWEIPGTGGLPYLPEVSDTDTTAQIKQDLEAIDLGDIDQQFEDIDTELNNL